MCDPGRRGRICHHFRGPGGLWGRYLGEQILKPGGTPGEAFAYATARTTECFARGQLEGDASLRYILFGDALMEFRKPGWERPPVAR